MGVIKITVDFIYEGNKSSWNIKVSDITTVSQLQIKLRRYAKLREVEACFLFFTYTNSLGFKNEKLYPGNMLLTDVQQELGKDVLGVSMLTESTFGDMDSRFVSATIKELNNGICWVLTLNYSFYNLYEYKEVFVYKSMEECIRKLSLERTHGQLVITDKTDKEVKIDLA